MTRAGAITAQLLEVTGELLASRTLLLASALFLPYVGALLGMGAAAAYGYHSGSPLPVQMLLWTEAGLGEWFEYSMTASVAALLFLLWHRVGATAYLANAFLFAWLTFDNSLQIHENGGEFLAPWLRGWNPEQITPAQLGELAMMLLVGCAWVGGLLTSLRNSHTRALAHSLIIAFLVFATAGFGVLVDFFDGWGTHSEVVTFVANFVEDGGELVLIAVTLIVVCAIFDVEKSASCAANSIGAKRSDPLGGDLSFARLDRGKGAPTAFLLDVAASFA